MVVNSLSFLLFFIVVFTVYYMPGVRQHAVRQNVWLLLTSYFFYGFVDWKMLPILLGVTIIFYWLGTQIKKEMDADNRKKASRYMKAGVVIGIGLLLYFKYLNFFADSVASLLNYIVFNVSWSTLNIILPIGVSFFTFKLISYVIEIKRKKTEPAESLLEFAVYISFFPTILSGPIDRPNTFLPQLKNKHEFNYNLAIDGCQQILWGIFTKMVIADNIALVTTNTWGGGSGNALYMIFGFLLSPVQVYADFDGYSNMAIGIGKILGFNITKNFNHPLLARNVSEYWNRWHISLTTWITDYVFTPLCLKFRDYANLGIMIAITANLVLIGLWHGANWTYAVFGVFHSILFIPIVYSGELGKNRKIKEGKYGMPLVKDFFRMVLTYIIIGIGHIIFFSRDVSSAVQFIHKIFISPFDFNHFLSGSVILSGFLGMIMFILEWTTKHKEFVLQKSSRIYTNGVYRLLAMDILLALVIALFGYNSQNNFIYFKF